MCSSLEPSRWKRFGGRRKRFGVWEPMSRTCAARDCSNPVTRGNQRFCHPRCKLREHRAGVRAGRVALPHRRPPQPETGAVVQTVPIERPASFAYADPPYPGRAHLYPENTEVDHRALVGRLVEDFPDGWALSTAADSLGQVLALCPPGVRVGSWHRQHRPYLERPNGWEPVIFCGGRRRPKCCIADTLIAPVPQGWDLPGRKPVRFYHWLFAFLGMLPGDSWFEPFPGSGTGPRVFVEWSAERRVPRQILAFPELDKG